MTARWAPTNPPSFSPKGSVEKKLDKNFWKSEFQIFAQNTVKITFRNLKTLVFDNFKHGNSAITHVKPIKTKQGPAMQKIADISSLFQVKNDQKPIFF